MNAKRLGASLAAIAVVTLTGVPVHAQWRDSRGSDPHDAGYRDGARAGGDDARDGRPFEYQRHRDYRSADGGYQSRDGSRDDYMERYRAGFMAGYRDGYYSGGGRGPSRGGPSYGGGPWEGRGPGHRQPGRSPVGDIASSNGFEEGYRKGLDDGRDRDRPDPWRHSRYRNADHGYRREYGPKRVYQQAFRAAFELGYESGYRDGRRNRARGGLVWRWQG